MIYAQANELLLLNGDCIELIKAMPDNCVDSIVTDPPYGISFMGKAWDNARMLARGIQGLDHNKDNRRSANQHAGTSDTSYSAGLSFQHFSSAWATEALRVIKPGGHLLSFSSSRTYHRMTSGIEDAGFEIRDQIMWLYGSGFPKSLNLEKSINKKDGVEFKEKPANGVGFMNPQGEGGYNTTINQLEQVGDSTERAKQWQGWGTALKPAHEPIVVARKPLIGTVVENVLTHGTGGINIDGTRVGSEVVSTHHAPKGTFAGGEPDRGSDTSTYANHTGRWPANVIHDGSDEVVKLFPSSTNVSKGIRGRGSEIFANGKGFANTLAEVGQEIGYGDSGSAARFFYCAKASKRDRNEGLDGFENKVAGGMQGRTDGSMGSITYNQNHHPTVKPTELMRYLVRLITPPNGIVLDPFTGSGSTGKACMLEDFNFIGIDLSQEYLEIANARIAFALENKSYELFK